MSGWAQRDAEEQEERAEWVEARLKLARELEEENEALRKRAELAESTLVALKRVLFAYEEFEEGNEGSAHPWWAVVQKNKMGARAICAGPFFSRERAQRHATAREHEYGKTIVYCFSGHRSEHYRVLRAGLSLDKE